MGSMARLYDLDETPNARHERHIERGWVGRIAKIDHDAIQIQWTDSEGRMVECFAGLTSDFPRYVAYHETTVRHKIEKIKALESLGIRSPRINYVIQASDIESAINMLHALRQESDVSNIVESLMAHKPECDRRLRPLVRGQPTKTSRVYYVNKQTGRRDLPIPTWLPEPKEISKKAPPSNKPMKI